MVICSLLLTAALAVPQAPQTLSFDLRDADLRGFLVSLAQAADLGVVLHPAVTGEITLNARDVPWELLLDMVLRNHGLGREIQGNMMRIAPLTAMEDEYRQRMALEEARLAAQPLVIRTFRLNYARAADVAPIVSAFLSARGAVIVDSRRNMLIIREAAPQP